MLRRVAIMVGSGLLIAACGSSTQNANLTPHPAPTPTTSSPSSFSLNPHLTTPSTTDHPAPPPLPPATVSLTGTGTKTSPAFDATGAWDIHYTYSCKNSSGGLKVTVAGHGLGQDPGVSVQGSSGENDATQPFGGSWTITVASTCHWTVNVYTS